MTNFIEAITNISNCTLVTTVLLVALIVTIFMAVKCMDEKRSNK